MVIVHDGPEADARGDAYAVQLAGAGLIVLDLLSHPADAEALGRALAWLAAQPAVDPARIGVLGFGRGAQAAMEVPFAARALLYPGCAALKPAAAPRAPVWIAHGLEDPTNPAEACRVAAARLAEAGAEVRLRPYPGAGFAWDVPAYGLGGQMAWLEAPVGVGRVSARPWAELAEMSATEAAGFLAVALAPGAP